MRILFFALILISACGPRPALPPAPLLAPVETPTGSLNAMKEEKEEPSVRKSFEFGNCTLISGTQVWEVLKKETKGAFTLLQVGTKTVFGLLGMGMESAVFDFKMKDPKVFHWKKENDEWRLWILESEGPVRWVNPEMSWSARVDYLSDIQDGFVKTTVRLVCDE
ncbi:MAG: hypothetical protein CL678_13625 [Bdellovibrionaceae bacterium]|nr:hypothetical protein [Pseudobdellovibrionaceae bacterium]|tara:strand:- start:482 stop:976 length:495 start_codon:yes stop_codon:yes gene_type:complete